MGDEQAFLEHLAADPGDDTTRRVYADWLEDHGDSRAEYLRLELELAQVTDGEPRALELEERAAKMRADLPPEWIERAGKRFEVWMVDYPSGWTIGTIIMVREVTGLGLKDAKDLVEAAPSCLAVNLSRPVAEQVRDRVRQFQYRRWGSDQELQRPRIVLCPDGAACPLLPVGVELPGYTSMWQRQVALRLLGYHESNRAGVVEAIRQLWGWSQEQAERVADSRLPVALGFFPSDREAKEAAELFAGLARVDTQRLRPPGPFRPITSAATADPAPDG
jgi:uncharacterized protein (TIGR02996 family)